MLKIINFQEEKNKRKKDNLVYYIDITSDYSSSISVNTEDAIKKYAKQAEMEREEASRFFNLGYEKGIDRMEQYIWYWREYTKRFKRKAIRKAAKIGYASGLFHGFLTCAGIITLVLIGVSLNG